MSLIVVTLVSGLTIAFAGFTADISGVAATRAHAQAAADAAALAAVAESGPYGSGRPGSQAGRIARANGARLIECLCDPGATAMQVEVAVGDVVARARAVMDPTAIAPASVAAATGLNPSLSAALDRLLAAAHGRVTLVSGYRSTAEQTELWNDALLRYGSPEAADDWVAPPGHSMHERGLAVDLGGDLQLAAGLVEELDLPLVRPLPNEPWHFELLGARA